MRPLLVGSVVAALTLLAVAGCAAPRAPTQQELEAIAAAIVARAEAPEYADVELTGISVEPERDVVIVGIRDDAPEFVREMLDRYGFKVGFIKGRVATPRPLRTFLP